MRAAFGELAGVNVPIAEGGWALVLQYGSNWAALPAQRADTLASAPGSGFGGLQEGDKVVP